ncbi:DUF421 domain-containing protein [Comamonas sp. NLF-1-9]|uniref:DUF421 domain-containing protein n=1 Tax=Comamonas sp. NLF-1-9 TaxID=2853163 RepID=UPI001C483C89|nr:YetF domain-containing protein [Comamonas sp. NLF-1-9]QXL85177.1 DUF421 domain-containing protein [Comamonas sp. NLF-1-9]
MQFLPTDWSRIFALETPLGELLLRAAVLYFGILFLMRIMPRRTGGELATMDLVLILLITEAASHSLGDYTALPDGVFMILVIMGFNYLVNALSYRVKFIERLVSLPPLQVIRDGRLLRRNMRREFLTEEELMSYLRQQGIDKIDDVKAAYIEGEGKVTVIEKKSAGK